MSDIGVKIGLEGDAQFKNSLKEINQSFKVLGSEMKLVASQFDKNDKSTAALAAKNQVLNKQIDEQKNKVEVLESALKQSAEQYGENDSRTQKWAIELNNAKAKLNDMEREVKNNENAMKDAENATENLGDETKDLGNDFDDTGKKSLTFGDLLKANLAADAIVAGVKAIGNAIKDIAKGFGDAITATAEYGDAVDKQSQKLRVSAEEYQKLAFAAERSGTSVETFSTAQKTLASTDFSGNLFDAVNAVASIADENERAARATELFGKKAGQELLPLLNSGADGVQALYDEIEGLGGIMSNEAVANAAAYQDSLTNLQTAFDGLKNNLSGEFLPAISEVMDGLSMLLSGDTSGLDKIQSGIKKVVDEFSKILPQIMKLGGDILKTLGDAIIANIPMIFSAVNNLIIGFIQFFIENLPLLITAAIELVVSLANGIVESLPELIPAIIETVITIVDALIDNVDKLIDAALAIILALADGLIKALPKLIEKAPEIVMKLVSAFIENAPKLLAASLELIVTLAKGIIANIGEVLKAAGEVVKELLGALSEGFKGAVDIGKEIVNGIWNGIKNGWKWLTDSVANLAKNLLKSTKEALGIQSPSRLFRDEVGAMMAAGIGVGFEDEMNDVKKQMEESIPTSINSKVTLESAVDRMSNVMAGTVNAMSTFSQSNQPIRVEIPISINGKELYRATLQDLWSVMSASPRVVSDAI